MEQLVIRNALTPEGGRVTIVSDDGVITEILPGSSQGPEADQEIDADDLLVMPGLCNTHTHSAMSLLRGVGEDQALDDWLGKSIWPLEAKMKLNHLKAGMELACLEMIKTGTTLFNDMYFMEGEMAAIVDGMGIRGILGEGFIDLGQEEKMEDSIRKTSETIRKIKQLGSSLIGFSLAPHAVYTVSREGLEWCRDTAREEDALIHIHVSETESEVSDFRRESGMSPPGYLDSLGMLSPGTVAAHSVHLDDDDIKLFADRRVKVSHNPVSNMKLGSGGPMRLCSMVLKGVDVTMGTDGAASNNSLDMFQCMKVAALLSRMHDGIGLGSSRRILDIASRAGYLSLGLDGGTVETGKLTDLILLDLNTPSMTPMHDPWSNMVYSATGHDVRYTIVNGRVVMKDGHVNREEEILKAAREAFRDLMKGDI